MIFLLIRGPEAHKFAIAGPPGVKRDFLSTGGGYGVDAQGTVISDSSIPESAAFSVALWYPPADYRGPLTITDRASGEQYIYELKEECITRTKSVV